MTARYRMTNKAAPTAPSAYVASTLQPIRAFLERHGEAADACERAEAGGDAPSMQPRRAWLARLLEVVCAAFRVRVLALIDTVRSMGAPLSLIYCDKFSPVLTARRCRPQQACPAAGARPRRSQ